MGSARKLWTETNSKCVHHYVLIHLDKEESEATGGSSRSPKNYTILPNLNMQILNSLDDLISIHLTIVTFDLLKRL